MQARSVETFSKISSALEKRFEVSAFKIPCCHAAVIWVNFHSDAVAARLEGCNHRCTRAAEWIKDSVSDKREHPY